MQARPLITWEEVTKEKRNKTSEVQISWRKTPIVSVFNKKFWIVGFLDGDVLSSLNGNICRRSLLFVDSSSCWSHECMWFWVGRLATYRMAAPSRLFSRSTLRRFSSAPSHLYQRGKDGRWLSRNVRRVVREAPFQDDLRGLPLEIFLTIKEWAAGIFLNWILWINLISQSGALYRFDENIGLFGCSNGYWMKMQIDLDLRIGLKMILYFYS